MTRRLLVLLAVVALLGALGACGSESASGPPSISYGRDACADCHMIIEDPRFAAAYRTSGGEARVFDDPGDLFIYGTRTGELAAGRSWVHDYDTEEWVDADQAWYVRSSSIDSPMARGLAAFGAQAAAEAFASDVSGEVLRWNDVLGLARAGKLEPASGAGEDPATDQAGSNQGGNQ